MKTNIKKTTVQGITFTTYSDFIARGTFAINDTTGECKAIRRNGYINNDLTVRKAIATAFGLSSFKK